MFAVRSNVRSTCQSFGRYFCRTRQTSIRKFETLTKPVLYGDEASPPVRFVMMTASILEVNLDFHRIDLFKSENKSEFYTKINLLQKVPALSVDGDVICDSHSIALYLCRKSKKQDLYPKDALTKARVDQMLYFNATNLFPIDSFLFTQFFAGKLPTNGEKLKQWYSSLEYLESRLRKYQWLADDKMWLCDICCAATISSLELLVPGLERYFHLKKWMENMEKQPFYEINTNGLKRLSNLIEIVKS